MPRRPWLPRDESRPDSAGGGSRQSRAALPNTRSRIVEVLDDLGAASASRPTWAIDRAQTASSCTLPLGGTQMDGLEIRYDDPTLRVAVIHNLTVAQWRDAPTLGQMRALDRIDVAKRRLVTGGVAFLNVIVEGVPRFTDEVREEAARQTAGRSGRDLAAAHLVLIGGLTGAAVRAFLSTVFLLGRPKFPTKVFSDVAECARWLAPLISEAGGRQWTSDQIVELVRAVREAPAA